MPMIRVESHEIHPYRVDIEFRTFAPGEYVPVKSRDFPEEQDEKRGETQIITGINAIYYDKNNDAGNPDWVVMAEANNVAPFFIDVSALISENAELKAERGSDVPTV